MKELMRESGRGVYNQSFTNKQKNVRNHNFQKEKEQKRNRHKKRRMGRLVELKMNIKH